MSLERLLSVLFWLGAYYFLFQRGRNRMKRMRGERAPAPASPEGEVPAEIWEELRRAVTGAEEEPDSVLAEAPSPFRKPEAAGPEGRSAPPAGAPGPGRPARPPTWPRHLARPGALREGIVLAEILGPPAALRRGAHAAPPWRCR